MKKELLQIRIDEELLNQLKALANSNAISISGQVRMLIKKAVRDGEQQNYKHRNRCKRRERNTQ